MKNYLQRQIHDRSQKILGPDVVTNSNGKRDVTSMTYNAEVSRKQLALAIVMHGYPLSLADHYYTNNFLTGLQPLFRVPCRNTIKKDILGMYEIERVKINKKIDANIGRIAITTDMWTATTQQKGYMAVTAHYIDNNWRLRNHLLQFIYVHAPHTADNLASRLFRCMMEWNVDAKLSSITLDNCSTNDKMINIIKSKLVSSFLIKDGALLHMRCTAHILNLIVKDGLDVLKDGIEKIRDSVVYWTATPKRIEFFQEVAKQTQIDYVNKLVDDCPTRWNSTYEMLSVALPYKDVFYRLKQRDESQSYTSCPNESQWEFAAVICDKLKIFNDISELFSGSSYPTTNLFFPKICELSGKLYEWRIDPDHRVSRMAELMWLKFSKYWMNIHELLAIAVILDPRCKLQMVEYWEIRLASTTNRICNEKMKDTLSELVGEYQRRNRLVNEHPASETNENFTSDDVDFDLFVSQKKRARTTPCQSELENYLDETLIPRSPDFNILMWWKMNGVKFPTLQAIARDLLAVPVTSVASESAFSAGGRLLDPHRSKLHSSTVESILCTKSWVHDELKIGKSLYFGTVLLLFKYT
ncbi:Putative AC transposase [Linum perenne]